jgi:hypothetical protein
MKRRRLILLSSLVLTISALSPVAALGAANGTDSPAKGASGEWHRQDDRGCHRHGPRHHRDLKGTSKGTTIVDLAAGTGTVDGTFRLTHLGHGTFHADITSSTPFGNTIVSTARTTFIAANGDKVFTTDVVIQTGNESRIVSTITGGTGRFAHARGTLTATNVSVIASSVGSIVTLTFTATAVGEITY